MQRGSLMVAMDQAFLTCAQIRAARAMLGWSLVDLARAARLSVVTARRIQDGDGSVTTGAAVAIRDAFQSNGILFLPNDGFGEGVRLRTKTAV